MADNNRTTHYLYKIKDLISKRPNWNKTPGLQEIVEKTNLLLGDLIISGRANSHFDLNTALSLEEEEVTEKVLTGAAFQENSFKALRYLHQGGAGEEAGQKRVFAMNCYLKTNANTDKITEDPNTTSGFLQLMSYTNKMQTTLEVEQKTNNELKLNSEKQAQEAASLRIENARLQGMLSAYEATIKSKKGPYSQRYP